jgi:hypothetical protein
MPQPGYVFWLFSLVLLQHYTTPIDSSDLKLWLKRVLHIELSASMTKMAHLPNTAAGAFL